MTVEATVAEDRPEPSRATRRARRAEREAVERACASLAARGELTERRRAALAALAHRLGRGLVDDTVAAAERSGDSEEAVAPVDPERVARLFSD